jgi:hypothetical protein
VIYVEQRDANWWATCDECDWKAGPCDTEAEAHAQADVHDRAMGEEVPSDGAGIPGGRAGRGRAAGLVVDAAEEVRPNAQHQD